MSKIRITKDCADQMIVDYLSDQISETDLLSLSEWVNDSRENCDYFLSQQEIWFSVSVTRYNVHDFDREKAYDEFMIRVNYSKRQLANKSVGTNFSSYPPPSKIRTAAKPMLQIAASLLVILLFSYGSFRIGERMLQNKFSEIIIESPLGSRLKFQLPDGSIIYLNSGSRAVYSQGFGVTDRKIELQGEGYFEVAHNPELPFSVATHDVAVQVLGTKFNFSNYPDESEAMVTLLEGKVKLWDALNNSGSFTLHPGQRMIFDKLTRNTHLVNVLNKKSTAWINGELYFDEERLDNIVKTLGRSYNATIRIANEETASLRFYGSFGRMDVGIDQVLSSLSSTNRIRICHINGEYIITKTN